VRFFFAHQARHQKEVVRMNELYREKLQRDARNKAVGGATALVTFICVLFCVPP
jgi:hypothetical protein